MAGKVSMLVLALLAGLAAQDARPKPSDPARGPLEVVRVSRSDAGGTTRFDPDSVERNYRNAAADLERALSHLEKKTLAKMEDGYDAGLPDPVRTVQRTWKTSKALPEQLRGITIYVVTLDRKGDIQGLPQDKHRRKDVVLISRAARLKDCGRLGSVTFLTREVAASLGIRTSRCRCVVSADGTEIEITEGDRP